MSNENPTQATTESPSVQPGAVLDQIDLERKAEADLTSFALDMFNADQPQNDEKPEEAEVEPESEEPIDNEEELSDGEADVDTPDETDEADEEDESALQEGELETIDFDEWSKYALEMDGETYTAAQIKSMLGRAKSLGKNAREASDKVKDVEAREAKIAEQEAWLEQRTSAAAQSDQLVEMQSEARKINAVLQKAREEGDMYEVAVQKDKLEILNQNYHKASQEVQAVQHKQQQEMMAKVEQGLRDRKLGYLLENNDQSKAWTEYASSKMSPQELQTALMIPAVAEAIEKARKYDASLTKPAKKLKSSGRTLSSKSNTPKPKVKVQSEDDYFLALANDVLGGR